MDARVLADTPLPAGYEPDALYLRRWLLDLRLRLDALPHERERLLKEKLYEFTRPAAGKQRPVYHRSNTHLLVAAGGK
jgi:hypothetical protein